jgi:hypothetical protein
VELEVHRKAVLVTQTDSNGKFLFINVPPNTYPDNYSITFTLENEGVRCKVSDLAFDMKAGSRHSRDFILDKTIFSGEEFSVLDTGELAICKSI